jgi:mannose-6-phosphate isomerase-like protein (cupin superfamily)
VDEGGGRQCWQGTTGQELAMKTTMTGFVTNIERDTVKNRNFRKVLFTADHLQLVVMSLKPGEDIGEEEHDVDQFIRVEQGQGFVEMAGQKSLIEAESAFVIPAGTKHNVKNTSEKEELKLYTLYSSPQHEDDAVHKTKAEAEEDEHE